MFAALIFTMSISALLQFVLSYRRAILGEAVGHTISEDILDAAGVKNRRVTAEDFSRLVQLYKSTPELKSSRRFAVLNMYYLAVNAVRAFADRMPIAARWCAGEVTNCALYAAAQIDR